jgi:predicted kinase
VIVCGLPGVGKTTIAKDLAPLIDAVVLSTDKIRKELIPNLPTKNKKKG